MRLRLLFCFTLVAAALTGCAPKIPKEALQLRPESFALRQLQTKRFDTKDEMTLIQAGASLLQDMGFQLDETETDLGVIVGSKANDATEAGQVVGAVVFTVLFGQSMAIDKEEKVRAALVTRPVSDTETTLRVTFQRMVWNNRGELWKIESLEDPELYQGFFSKLSKAVFLTANDI